MAMTQQVKAELATIKVTKPCCRRSEVASMLRFAGGIHIVSGRIVVEVEFDTGAAARRLRSAIQEQGVDLDLELLFRTLDYTQWGGAPLLGVNGVTIICHGGSPPIAIRNALGAAASCVESGMVGHIAGRLNRLAHD